MIYLQKTLPLILSTIFIYSSDCVQAKTKEPQELIETLTPLTKALKLKNSSQDAEALKKINDWKPSESFMDVYKKFYTTVWSNDLDEVWSLYKKLKSEKKMIRLRLDLFRRLIQASDQERKNQKKITDAEIKKESKNILKQLRGTSEGELLESEYIHWLNKNQYYNVVCTTEKKRWATQPDLNFSDVQKGMEECPLTMDEFLLRLRRLIFAAKEDQALQEVGLFIKGKPTLPPWQKAYIQAVYDSNVGDPLKAFESLVPYEKELVSSADYADNYFYIAQRAGLNDKALDILDLIQKNNLNIKIFDQKKQDEFLFQKGHLLYQSKKYQEAYNIFNQLYSKAAVKNKKRKIEKKQYEQLAWMRAWTLYLKNDYEQAQKAFLEMRPYTTDSSRLNYWLAMAHLRNNQPLVASQIFKKLSESVQNNEVFTYYSLLAWERFQDLKKNNKDLNSNILIKDLLQLTKSKNSTYPTPGDQYSRGEVVNIYNFILEQSSGDEDNIIAPVNDENRLVFSDEEEGLNVSSDSDLKKHLDWAKYLIDQGEAEFAKWHLFDLEKNIKIKSQSKILAQFYEDNQFYYRALSLTQRKAVTSRMSFDSDLFWIQMLHPRAYEDSVMTNAQQRQVDPLFIWSIMKAETQFKSDAISPVGAVGLMQFMPYTLEKLNGLIEEDTNPQELFIPEKSIERGAAYLKKLFIEFIDQKPLVAAAYNGGPHRVKAWLKKWGFVDYDVFIEHIPMAETRTYVKRVLTFNAIYDKLYFKKLNYDQYKYLLQQQPMEVSDSISLVEEWDMFKNEIKKTNVSNK